MRKHGPPPKEMLVYVVFNDPFISYYACDNMRTVKLKFFTAFRKKTLAGESSSIKHDLARSCFQLWPKIGDEGDKILRNKTKMG